MSHSLFEFKIISSSTSRRGSHIENPNFLIHHHVEMYIVLHSFTYDSNFIWKICNIFSRYCCSLSSFFPRLIECLRNFSSHYSIKNLIILRDWNAMCDKVLVLMHFFLFLLFINCKIQLYSRCHLRGFPFLQLFKAIVNFLLLLTMTSVDWIKSCVNKMLSCKSISLLNFLSSIYSSIFLPSVLSWRAMKCANGDVSRNFVKDWKETLKSNVT